MRTISLFAGAGGMDLGAHGAGAEIIFANDSMQEAGTTHRRLFPEAEFVLGDVQTVDSFPRADLVIGGYPCQSFSLGGNRTPHLDDRTQLYQEFGRCLATVNPRYFVAENVKGLKSVGSGRWLIEQLDLFANVGEHGYNLSWAVLRAEDYGVPQKRRRLFIVGVRKDLEQHYWFPPPTHAPLNAAASKGLLPYESHGDAIRGLPLWPSGEFYERPHDPEGHWSWYYMSRNRKAKWNGPSFTIVANFRHVTLHPASKVMKLTWSNLADGWKQRWDFADEYEHLLEGPDRPVLDEPRRLSWRECARIQTFPPDFEPDGDLEHKFEQIGNAVPPRLAEAVLAPLISGAALRSSPHPSQSYPPLERNQQLSLRVA